MVTTNLENGITNAASTSPLGTLTQLDPTKVHNYFEDFNLYRAADWIVTTVEAGSGAATEAIADEDKGVLVLTNDDALADSDFLQLANETVKLKSGKQCHFKARIKVSEVLQSEFVIGLQIRTTNPLSVSDGVYFIVKSNNIDLEIFKDSNALGSLEGIGSLVDDTYIELAFVYDGGSKVQAWVDGVKKGESSLGVPDDEELTISYGIQNKEAVAKSMSIDYIFVANER